MLNEIISGSTSIVLLGQFNPMIFQPQWLHLIGAIGEEELKIFKDHKESVEVIHPDIVALKPDWGSIRVERNKFTVEALTEPAIRAHDFTVTCFTRLADTPVGKMGINRKAVIHFQNEEKWHLLGDTLAPKGPWGDEMFKDGERRGGMLSLTMQQLRDVNPSPRRHDDLAGYVRITIDSLMQPKYSIHVSINDHYEAKDTDNTVGTEEIMQILRDQWDDSSARAVRIFNQIAQMV